MSGEETERSRGKTDPHNLTLLLQHLESCQLLHVVLSCAIVQNLLGTVNETTQAITLAEGPSLHVAGTAHPLQCSHT
jgi:hypothetical protein